LADHGFYPGLVVGAHSLFWLSERPRVFVVQTGCPRHTAANILGLKPPVHSTLVYKNSS